MELDRLHGRHNLPTRVLWPGWRQPSSNAGFPRAQTTEKRQGTAWHAETHIITAFVDSFSLIYCFLHESGFPVVWDLGCIRICRQVLSEVQDRRAHVECRIKPNGLGIWQNGRPVMLEGKRRRDVCLSEPYDVWDSLRQTAFLGEWLDAKLRTHTLRPDSVWQRRL